MSSVSTTREQRTDNNTAANNAITHATEQQIIPDFGIYTVQASDDISPPTTVHTVPLNVTNSSLFDPIHTTGCCGLGHRLSLSLRTFVYALLQGRTSKVHWSDVPWSVLFHDTDFIVEGIGLEGLDATNEEGLFFPNNFPEHWSGRPTRNQTETGSAMDKFDPNLLDNPLGISILVSLRDSLNPLVLSYRTPLRAQLNHYKTEKTKKKNHVTICTHVRQGNNETGDWQQKTWRHINLHTIMTATQRAMEQLVLSRNATAASIYVASDNGDVQPWFEANIPKNWTVIQPGKRMPKPDKGVWFGAHGSSTNQLLNQTMKNEALAEAMADVFALGECEALFIPNYSSFSYAGIALTKARGKLVYFGKQQDDDEFTYLEMEELIGRERRRRTRRSMHHSLPGGNMAS
mmetsp:Transcript_12577/g.14298  ORF Transcript_12577/g.14298 Transcript_12577/m.14298 type:complete len:403 (-) Transcript_12577:117-1325(-)